MPAAPRPADDVGPVLDVVDEWPVDVGQFPEGEGAHGQPVVVEGAVELGREGQRHLEDLAAHEAGRAGDDVGLQLGAEVVPGRHPVGPVGRRELAPGVVDDPQVAEGERGAAVERGGERRELGRMPDVILVAGRHEARVVADARVAALERAPGAGPLLVVLAHEAPLDALLSVERRQLALQAFRHGTVHGEADRDHDRRIARGPRAPL